MLCQSLCENISSDVVKLTLVTRLTVLRLLLVEENDLIANRFVTLLNTICSVVRFRNATDAEDWIISKSEVNLIITNRKNGHSRVTVRKSNFDFRSVPVLIICTTMDNGSVKKALKKV